MNRYVYDPYGNPAAGTAETVANPWQFAGGYRDGFSGYYKFGTRYYDSTVGRWTQPDPSRQDANRYAYSGSNPVNFVDSTGLVSKKLRAVVAGAAGILASLGCYLITKGKAPIFCGSTGAAAGVGTGLAGKDKLKSELIGAAGGLIAGWGCALVVTAATGGAGGPVSVLACSGAGLDVLRKRSHPTVR